MTASEGYFWGVVALVGMLVMLAFIDAWRLSRRPPGGTRFVSEDEIIAIECEIAKSSATSERALDSISSRLMIVRMQRPCPDCGISMSVFEAYCAICGWTYPDRERPWPRDEVVRARTFEFDCWGWYVTRTFPTDDPEEAKRLAVAESSGLDREMYEVANVQLSPESHEPIIA